MTFIPLYDLFFDLPHPAASPSCEQARIFGPPPSLVNAVGSVIQELYDPSNVARVARFAFPDHDDQLHVLDDSHKILDDEDLVSSPGLNGKDVYIYSFIPHRHVFTLRLKSGVRIHGHVRRYLPPHSDANGRADVGRRGMRAFCIMTRAFGGERFYNCVLKTVEAIRNVASDMEHRNEGLGKSSGSDFLHKLLIEHARMCLSAKKCRNTNSGNSCDNTLSSGSSTLKNGEEEDAAVDSTASTILRISNTEFVAGDENHNLFQSQDYLQFELPPALIPDCQEQMNLPQLWVGDAGHSKSSMSLFGSEHIESPIMPLLRCLAPSNFMRLISALLCQRRVILISSSIPKLSTCVCGASSILAAGMLEWQHILIPILPPHLLKYLVAPTPYLIGLLTPNASNLEMIPGMGEVLTVNLDANTLQTYHMPNPAKSIPDLLANTKAKTQNAHEPGETTSVAELLAWDLKEVIETDKRMFYVDRKTAKSGAVDETEDNGNQPQNTTTSRTSGNTGKGLAARVFRRSQQSGVQVANPNSGGVNNTSKKSQGQKKMFYHGISQKMAVQNIEEKASVFGRLMRKNLGDSEGADDSVHEGSVISEGDKLGAQGTNIGGGKRKKLAYQPQQKFMEDAMQLASLTSSAGASGSGIDLCDCCENEKAEEMVRVALVSFFLVMFGDMGMYLSEADDGKLVLDRKKFLILKKLQGETEKTPMFSVLATLTRSGMFRDFVKERIHELETPPEKEVELKILPFRPLFVLCERALRLNMAEMTVSNIRPVVKYIASELSRRQQVSLSENIRSHALDLTSKTQIFDGNSARDLVALAEQCRDINGVLVHVMGVVWTRMHEGRSSQWRSPMFALHVLRSLLLHGPFSAITEGTDGIDNVRNLMNYSPDKIFEGVNEVRALAACVHDLLIDRARLFTQRRYCADRKRLSKILKPPRWADYLVRRLPISISFQRMHDLVAPKGSCKYSENSKIKPKANPILNRDDKEEISALFLNLSAPIMELQKGIKIEGKSTKRDSTSYGDMAKNQAPENSSASMDTSHDDSKAADEQCAPPTVNTLKNNLKYEAEYSQSTENDGSRTLSVQEDEVPDDLVDMLAEFNTTMGLPPANVPTPKAALPPQHDTSLQDKVNQADGVPQQNGHFQEPNGYLQEPNGHLQQQNNYVQGNTGFTEEHNGHFQQQNGHFSQQNGYFPQQNGHFQQQNSHSPQQNGHFQEPSGYLQGSSGHFQQQNNYTQENAGFSQEQYGHFQQQQSFTQERNSFSQERSSFSQEHNGFSHEQNSFPHEQNGFSQEQNSFPYEQNGFSQEQPIPSQYQNGLSNPSTNFYAQHEGPYQEEGVGPGHTQSDRGFGAKLEKSSSFIQNSTRSLGRRIFGSFSNSRNRDSNRSSTGNHSFTSSQRSSGYTSAQRPSDYHPAQRSSDYHSSQRSSNVYSRERMGSTCSPQLGLEFLLREERRDQLQFLRDEQRFGAPTANL